MSFCCLRVLLAHIIGVFLHLKVPFRSLVRDAIRHRLITESPPQKMQQHCLVEYTSYFGKSLIQQNQAVAHR